MKPSFFLLPAVWLVLLPFASGEEPKAANGELTARELAYHLGVTSWTSAIQLGNVDHALGAFASH